MKNLTVISDWAKDDLFKKEFTSALLGEILEPGHPKIDFLSCSTSSIHTGFLAFQTIQTEERLGIPNRNVYFLKPYTKGGVNETQTHLQEAPFVIAILYSKLIVCGINIGYTLSFIKERIQQLFVYRDIEKGSIFRSRDLFPKVIARLLEEKQDDLQLEEMELTNIPDLTGCYVGHIDNFGNIKTTIPQSSLGHKLPGDKVEITIGNATQTATFSHNLTAEKPGVLLIIPGSSGKEDNRFLDLAVKIKEKSKSAADLFNNPFPGTPTRLV